MNHLGKTHRAAILALAVWGTVTLVGRADEGPVVIGQRERPPILSLDPFHGSLELDAIYQGDSTTNAGLKSSSTDTVMQQKLSLSTGGGIVSKNLVDWHASGLVGLSEEWFHTGDESQTSSDTLYAFDLEALGLKNTDYPVSLFARRTQDYVDRSFASLLQNTTTTYGGTAAYRAANLPTTLRIYQTETVQSDLAGAEQYQTTEQHLDFQTEFSPADRQHLTLNYQAATVAESTPGSFSDDYTTQNADATHTWSIDGEGRYTLTQMANYNQQTGKFATSLLRLDEMLRMRHTDWFETYLNYDLDQQSYTSSTSQTNLINGGFTHRLFESLTTNGNAGYSTIDRTFSGENGSASTDQTYFGNLSLNYRKKVPLGELGANMSVGYSQTENGAVGATQQVLDENHTFTDPQPIVLTQPNINPQSIAIFNATGTRRYVEGIDYQVQQIGNTLQIERQVGGNINAGDPVLLDYNLDPLPGYTFATRSFGTGANYNFTEGALKGLGLFLQYSQQDQTIASSGPLSIQPDNVRDTLGGAEYHFWKLTLHAEEEFHESTLTPFDATRFFVQYADRLGDRTTLSLNANETMIHYSSDGGQTNYTNLDGRIEYQVNRNLRLLLLARWRNDEDTRFGNTTGFEEQPEVRWTYRQTSAYILVRHSYLTTAGDTTEDLLVQAGITRNF